MIPTSVREIGTWSFCKSGLERLVIPEGVGEIQGCAFEGCTNLEEVAFEEGSKLETIRGRAFHRYRVLAKIVLPKGLKRIGAKCFCGSGLEEVILPASVREVGAEAFASCN